MTAGPPRRGRRDNGLHAAEYAIAADVDPRVGEHLLDVLGLAGIAAYLQPAADLHPVTRTTTLPSRPTDRLYVDREHLAEARGYLDQLSPDEADRTPGRTARQAPGGPAAARRGAESAAEPDGLDDGPSRPDAGRSDPDGGAGGPEADPTAPPAAHRDEPTDPPAAGAAGDPSADLDAAWARIVADFDQPLDAPVPPWPVSEDLDDEPAGRDRTGEKPVDRSPERRADERSTGPAGAGDRWRADPDRQPLIDALDAEADEEGYEPPPPPPIPRPSRYTAVALVAIAVGLVLLFWPAVLGGLGLGNEITIGLGFCGILAGFVTLVWRLRSGDDGDEDPDDGAVV